MRAPPKAAEGIITWGCGQLICTPPFMIREKMKNLTICSVII